MKPNQTDCTFYLNVYQDTDLLAVCLTQLRKIYPQSRLMLRSDGDPNPAIANIAKEYNAECYYGERLFTINKGGEIVHEMLRLFLLANETNYLFKIDPDTRIVRTFKALPEQPCIFGTLQQQPGLVSMQGGCIGFTLDIVKKLYTSKFFLDPALAELPPPWVITPALRRRPMELGLTSIDWTVGWASQKMEIALVDWPEIMSEWQVTPENDDQRYAVTHPHKFGPPIQGAKRCALRYWQNVASITGHLMPPES